MLANETSRQGPGMQSLPGASALPVSKAVPAERAGMPAGRTIEHRAASAIWTAMPAGAAATGDANGVGRNGLVERGQRHRLGCRHRHHAEADGKGGSG